MIDLKMCNLLKRLSPEEIGMKNRFHVVDFDDEDMPTLNSGWWGRSAKKKKKKVIKLHYFAWTASFVFQLPGLSPNQNCQSHFLVKQHHSIKSHPLAWMQIIQNTLPLVHKVVQMLLYLSLTVIKMISHQKKGH